MSRVLTWKLAAASAPAVLVVVLLGATTGTVTALLAGTSSDHPAASAQATADIPTDYLDWYQHAARDTCPRLPWTVLAGIGKVESDHGRSPLPGVHFGTNIAGARGPLQFLQPTFDQYANPTPPDGANPPSPYDPPDAIWAAARMLCHNGANRGDLHAAVFAYNHSDTYVDQVLTWSRRYTTTPPATAGPPNAAAAQAIEFATEQLGLPYTWGGNGPRHGDPGFDCSGLTHAAYATAGIPLPRTAQAQYEHGPHVPTGLPLLPGDLVFYGTPRHVHHVGLYTGHGHMIHAPDLGQPIQISNYRWAGDDYLGATRPATG